MGDALCRSSNDRSCKDIDYGTPRSKSEKMVSLSIDGERISVPEGTSIMRAAMETGIEIPKLCATDMLDAFGSCRLCLIEIEGRGGTPASCTTPVAEASWCAPRASASTVFAKASWSSTFRTIRSICSIAPSMPALTYSTPRRRSGLRRCATVLAARATATSGVDDFILYFTFDPAKCIVCSRCVRACEEVQGTFALTISGRGFDLHRCRRDGREVHRIRVRLLRRLCASLDALSHEFKAQISKGAGEFLAPSSTKSADLPFYCQRIVAGAEHLGWAIVFGLQTPSGAVQLALGEICVTIALHRMKELAAARALSDKLSSLLWEMIDASEDVRRVAYQRAQDLGVDLSGDLCVMLCGFEDLFPAAAGELPTAPIRAAGGRRSRSSTRLPSAHRMVRLCTLRGDELVVVVPSSLERSLGTMPNCYARTWTTRCRVQSPE